MGVSSRLEVSKNKTYLLGVVSFYRSCSMVICERSDDVWALSTQASFSWMYEVIIDVVSM